MGGRVYVVEVYGFGIWGRIWDLGAGAYGFRAWDFEFQSSSLGVQGSGVGGSRATGSGFRAEGSVGEGRIFRFWISGFDSSGFRVSQADVYALSVHPLLLFFITLKPRVE